MKDSEQRCAGGGAGSRGNRPAENDIVCTTAAGTKITFRCNGNRTKWEGMRMPPDAAWDDWGDAPNVQSQISSEAR